MERDSFTDYAAIIRAAKEFYSEIPLNLQSGKNIYSPEYGEGKIVSLLGKRLLVKFSNHSIPLQFPDWQEAIDSGIISDRQEFTSSLEANHSLIIQQQIARISQPQFHYIATELIANLSKIQIDLPNLDKSYPLPQDLPLVLKNALKQVGINNLYGHQLEALFSLRKGQDLVLATPTASGKTLCYNLAILESCLNHPNSCALYIFPLKALAFDQLRKLERILQEFPNNKKIKIGQMTGDTKKEERKKLFFPSPPQILAVSPDLLHYQLEKVRRSREWQNWLEFLRNLRWVVIDESHTYIGAFGSHFANLMRRLRHAVDSVGGESEKLQFICASATIGNPLMMASRLLGNSDRQERLHLINKSQATSAEKIILCTQPTETANPDACKLILLLLQQNLTGIVFCNSRVAVKNLLALIKKESKQQNLHHLSQTVVPFYSSLTGSHRRHLIQQLSRGKVKVILATSALEAGIDLPELDFCLIRGYPGSIMSFRQRIGRVGRKNPGLVIFLPVAQNPLDYYYGKYPEKLLSESAESAIFNPDYPTILSKHLLCCCLESGLLVSEIEKKFGWRASAIASELLQQKKLFLASNSYLQGYSFPHADVNIRGNIASKIALINLETNEPFEEMTLDLAYQEVFPGAIYRASDAEGNLITYRCEKLDVDNYKAFLKPLPNESEVFTQAQTDLQVKCLELLEEPKIISTVFPENRFRLRLHWGEITFLVTGYKVFTRQYCLTCINRNCPYYHRQLSGKKCPVCHHKLGQAEITELKEKNNFKEPYLINYQAPVVKIEINPQILKKINQQVEILKTQISSKYQEQIPEILQELWNHSSAWLGLHSLIHQISFSLPLVVLSSHQDINSIVTKEKDRFVGYFFDTCDGGNGASEAIFEKFNYLVEKAKSLTESCDCHWGCPRCLIQSGCPQHNSGLNKDLGLFLLKAIA